MATQRRMLHFDERLLTIPESVASGLPPLPPLVAAQRGGSAAEGCFISAEARLRPLRKCASTPTLHSMATAAALGGGDAGEEQGMEVYVVLRPFKELGGGLFRRLPRRMRSGVRDAGICHYLAVFKQRDGSLVQFDFGPRGGDIHVAQGPFAFLSKSADGKMRRLVPGEVRERRLSKLPEAHMLVGRTPLSLADIRAWNELQQQESMDYELHRNDCRHYINCLVRYTTGREQAASALLSHRWQQARAAGSYGLASGVVRVSQFFTDLANWGKVQLAGNVGMAGVLALSGHRAIAVLRPLTLLPSATARLQPMGKVLMAPVRQALAGPVRQALLRKPVVVGTTAAVATLAASSNAAQGPAMREAVSVGARVAATVRTAAHATLAAAGTAVSCAGAATSRTTSQAAVIAGSLAGAASRGAAGLMAARPHAPTSTTSTASGANSVSGGGGGGGGGLWGRHVSSPGSPPRASLPSFRGMDRSQRLALAITSVTRR